MQYGQFFPTLFKCELTSLMNEVIDIFKRVDELERKRTTDFIIRDGNRTHDQVVRKCRTGVTENPRPSLFSQFIANLCFPYNVSTECRRDQNANYNMTIY